MNTNTPKNSTEIKDKSADLGSAANQTDNKDNSKVTVSKEGTQAGPLFKITALVLFIFISVIVIRYTPIKNYITPDRLFAFRDSVGVWAPILYIIFYAIGATVFIPGTLLTGVAAALFGTSLGFIVAYTGAMLAASISFWIARTLGRDFAASFVGDKLKKYDDALEKNGFDAVLYMRLIFMPFGAMNYGIGLTKVRFRDYFFGSALGMVIGAFIFVFVIGTLKEIWVSGDWSQLFSFKIGISVVLIGARFYMPFFIKRFKGDHP